MIASRSSEARSQIRTRPQVGGLRIGLIVVTVVVLTAACGSIDVVTGDAGGGSGGTVGGGMGGVHGGGTGGTQGSGGLSGGGAGGTNRGSGGMNGGGTGGMGNGGMTGSGGSGGSGPSCTQLQKAFVAALADAKMCVVGASGYCGVVTSDKLDCGCPTHVNDTKNIDPIRTQWAQSGCGSGVCPNIACIAYKSATCAVPSGSMTPICQDQATLPTP
jgi:hypothetical protein